MEIFSALLAICVGKSPVTSQRPVTRSFDVFFDLRPNKRLSKQPWGWWFETLSLSLWRHCNAQRDGSVESVPMPWCRHSISTRFNGVWVGRQGQTYCFLNEGNLFMKYLRPFIQLVAFLAYNDECTPKILNLFNTFWATLYQQLIPLLTHDILIKVLSVDQVLFKRGA